VGRRRQEKENRPWPEGCRKKEPRRTGESFPERERKVKNKDKQRETN
jgi:hypothetical protein